MTSCWLLLLGGSLLMGSLSATSRTFPINASLRVAPQPQELSLTLKAGPTCSDALACPTNARNSVSFPYSNGRTGKLTATYDADGSLNLEAEGNAGTSSAILSATNLAVGDGLGASCRVAAASTQVQFNNCGFSQVFRDDVIYREVVVQVRHRFAPGGSTSSPVHFFGGVNIRIRVYLHSTALPAEVATVPEANQGKVGVCSALNHELLAEVAPIANKHQFTVRAKSSTPSDVGFKLESCVLRPYLLNSQVLSMEPTHAIKLVENGIYVGQNAHEVLHQGTPGKSYTMTIPRFRPKNVPGVPPFDRVKSAKIFCDVCLCALSGAQGDSEGKKLPPCPDRVARSVARESRVMSPFWEIIPDGEMDAGLEAGNVEVVSSNHWLS